MTSKSPLAGTTEWRERERSRRDRLEPLLPTIAGALDIREVFPTMSTVIQEVLPHETLILALLDPDGRSVTIHASVNIDSTQLARYRITEQVESVRAEWRYFLAYDLEALDRGTSGILRCRTSPPDAADETWVELRPGPMWTRAVSERGLRSMLRVPIRVNGEAAGVLAFSSQAPNAYGEEDVSIAARIADHVSLAQAHERLALPATPEQPPARLHDVQRALVAKALADANGNRSHTACLLGLSRGELYTLLRRYSM